MRNYREATQIHIKVLLQCQVYIYSTSTANNTHKNKNSVIAFIFFSEVDPLPPVWLKKQIKLLNRNCDGYIWLFLQSSKIGSFIFTPLPLCSCTIWTSFFIWYTSFDLVGWVAPFQKATFCYMSDGVLRLRIHKRTQTHTEKLNEKNGLFNKKAETKIPQ